jgi:hypothetical protein
VSELIKSDFDTQLWKKLEAVLNDRLEKYRKQNDQNLDDKQTAELRGRIREIKSLLALSTKPVEQTNDAD